MCGENNVAHYNEDIISTVNYNASNMRGFSSAGTEEMNSNKYKVILEENL